MDVTQHNLIFLTPAHTAAMSNDGTLNSQPCGGLDNDHDGCGVIFPRMSPGTLLCQLCKKLKKEGLTDDEVAHLKVRCCQS